MRVVFMGTPEFAVPSLRALCADHEVLAVYTRPDRPRRRGNALEPSPVKAAAVELGLPVVQPSTLRDEVAVAHLRTLEPDVICVAAYGLILPPEVIALPRLGCLNVHASLLPRHRGAAPVHRAILTGDEFTGVSIMQMEAGLDTGPYASVRHVAVGNLPVEALSDILAHAGAEALLETLVAMEAGTVEWTVQDETLATYASKVSDSDVALDPGLAVTEALRRIRASTRSARSKVLMCGRAVDILAAAPAAEPVAPGVVSTSNGSLLIGLADGAIEITELRPAGKHSLAGHAFICGVPADRPLQWSHTE